MEGHRTSAYLISPSPASTVTGGVGNLPWLHPPTSSSSTTKTLFGAGTLGIIAGRDRAEAEGAAGPGKNKAMKKTRRHKFAFQTRSYVDVLDDGYRWRKYGQKAVKNSRFPRSYYRCTHEGCNVKKQVQRLSKDEEVVVTTYEGVHSHPVDKPTDDFNHILRQMRVYPASLHQPAATSISPLSL